jgi:hypothetical protein
MKENEWKMKKNIWGKKKRNERNREKNIGRK